MSGSGIIEALGRRARANATRERALLVDQTKRYELRLYDRTLLVFSAMADAFGNVSFSVLDSDEDARGLFPLPLMRNLGQDSLKDELANHPDYPVDEERLAALNRYLGERARQMLAIEPTSSADILARIEGTLPEDAFIPASFKMS